MKIFYILVCSFLLLSCGSTKEKAAQNELEQKNIDSVSKHERLHEPIISSQMGGFTTPQIWVIKEPKALSEVYGQINRTRKPGFKIPKVDLSKETIVAIFMGEKTSGGYAVTVKEVKERAGKIVVDVIETTPKTSDMVVTVITQPFCIIKVNNASKNMVFEKLKI